MTVQSEAEQTNILHILKRHGQTGIIDHLNLTEQHFPDVTELGDFADVMRTAQVAEAEFMKLPSKVREIFKHDVSNWLDTAHDPEKRASLVEAGVLPAVEPTTSEDVSNNPGGNADPGNSPEPPSVPA